MQSRASSLIAAAFMAAFVFAAQTTFAAKAKGPPLAGIWNIAPSGRAASSGDLHFRITRNGGTPVDVKVAVNAGAQQQTVARSIRNALGAQLRSDQFNVELGSGDNVLVSDPRGEPNFSLELIDSNIEDLRVQVQSVSPTAAPTVPAQATPAEAPPKPTPNDAPGDVEPRPGNSTVIPGTGMGIPDNSTPKIPNTSPPAPAPVPAPGSAAPSPGNAAPSPGNSAPAQPPAIETPAPTPQPAPAPPPPQR